MRIAIKKLSNSDLSFFKIHLKLSKQKGINLNSNVFVDEFFPGLKGSFVSIQFQLGILGPKGRQVEWLSRKVLRSKGAKNWRLNGEFVHDPDDDPLRYSQLHNEDYAILAFEGAVQPSSVVMVLVSQVEDQQLHKTITDLFSFSGRNTMKAISADDIYRLRQLTEDAYEQSHPLDIFDLPDTIEDALFDSSNQTSIRRSNGKSIPLTTEQLQQQLRVAHEVGQLGEELFRNWLLSQNYDESEFEWVSMSHARAAYDFELQKCSWLSVSGEFYVDVKTTKGPFERTFHMSKSELVWASEHDSYKIARISEVDSDAPKIRILGGISKMASSILDKLDALPEGVSADSVSLQPALLEVEATGNIEVIEDDF